MIDVCTHSWLDMGRHRVGRRPPFNQYTYQSRRCELCGIYQVLPSDSDYWMVVFRKPKKVAR